MNFLQKLYEMRDKKKADNKGFSLVELIIVIAIMAILVGIVGTQVIPYINKSKEAKDFQIINSYSTAATTAYSSNAEKITKELTDGKKTQLIVDVYATGLADSALTVAEEVKTLTGYADISNLTGKMGSTKGKKIQKIQVIIDIGTKKITTQAYEDDAFKKPIFDAVVAEL